MTQEQAEYVTEALELLHGEPSIEIESPRKVTQRRNGELVEAEKSAFVKIYTSFKKELKDIAGDDLKVWLYLALSINRYTKDARPGLRKIAEDTGMAVNTVRACVERLDVRRLLDTEKSEGKGNIYRPSDYVSVTRTVSNGDTVPIQTVSKNEPTVSKNEPTVSKNEPTVSGSREEFAQLEELEELEKLEKDVLDGIIHYQLKPKGMKDAFAKHFRLTPNWEAKYNRQFLEFLVDRNATPEQVKRAARLWGSDQRFNWKVPDLKGIQEHWLELIKEEPEPLNLVY